MKNQRENSDNITIEWWNHQNLTSQEALGEVLENSRNVFCVGVALRHWETPENTSTAIIPKSNYTTLTDKWTQEIQHQAELRKKMGIPNQNLKLHFAPITRDIQTARVFCTSLGIEFPDDAFFEELDTFSKKETILRELQMHLMWWNNDIYIKLFKHLDKNLTEKMQVLFNEILTSLGLQPSLESLWMMNEQHSAMILKLFWEVEKKKKEKSGRYPHFVVTDALATRRKGEKLLDNKAPKIWSLLGYTQQGRESAQSARMRAATYMTNILQQPAPPLSADIFIVHRTGWEGFLDGKYERKHLYHQFEGSTGDMECIYFNQQGECLSQKDIPYFEFDLGNYEKEIRQLSKYIEGLDPNNSLIKNQDMVNKYFLHRLERYEKVLFKDNIKKDILSVPLSGDVLLCIFSILQELEEIDRNMEKKYIFEEWWISQGRKIYGLEGYVMRCQEKYQDVELFSLLLAFVSDRVCYIHGLISNKFPKDKLRDRFVEESSV